jgi:hypothetical protein
MGPSRPQSTKLWPPPPFFFSAPVIIFTYKPQRKGSLKVLQVEKTRGIRWVPGLCGRAVSRVPDIQFTRELFLRVPNMSISTLLYVEHPYSDHLDLQTDIRAKWVTYAIFGFLGPYKNYTCHISMVSRNRLTTKCTFGSTRLWYTFWSYRLFLHLILLIKKVQLFKVPFRGTWIRRENLEIHTYNSHENWFYMYLMSKSTLMSVECPYSDHLDLHPNVQKTRFCHFPFARFFWASRRIRKLKHDSGR